jgi:sulfur carrier protein
VYFVAQARGYNYAMQIHLNGQPHACRDGESLAELLTAAGYSQRRVAVEVNREIVPRSAHGQHVLREGDHVEIVHAIGGG